MKLWTATILTILLVVILSCDDTSAGGRPGRRPHCNLPSDAGRCRMSRTRWHYDSSVGECRNFTWGGCGGNDNKFSAKSVCERVCSHRCPLNTCTRTCDHGNIIDERGCTTCSCQPGPEQAHCPSMDPCPSSCPHGYLNDTHGCMTCECKPDPTIRSLVKRRSPPKVPQPLRCPPDCSKICPFGNKRDENGCAICECSSREERCGALSCSIECPTGFAKNRRGCDLCVCTAATAGATRRQRVKPDSTSGSGRGRSQSRSGRRRENDCGIQATCMLFCPQGFEKDSKGCNTCACRQNSPAQTAQRSASNETDSPAQISANIPAQLPADVLSEPNVDTECTRKRCHRFKSCAFGYAKDEFGCDTCVCGDVRSGRTLKRYSSTNLHMRKVQNVGR